MFPLFDTFVTKFFFLTYTFIKLYKVVPYPRTHGVCVSVSGEKTYN